MTPEERPEQARAKAEKAWDAALIAELSGDMVTSRTMRERARRHERAALKWDHVVEHGTAD